VPAARGDLEESVEVMVAVVEGLKPLEHTRSAGLAIVVFAMGQPVAGDIATVIRLPG
jgi:hypothetical protein